jgi:acyl carrier protein
MKAGSIPIADIEDVVEEYVVSSLSAEKQGKALRKSEDLLMVLDSLQILRLVMQLETVFEFKVQDSEITPENFGSVEKVAAFVAQKLL